MDKTPESTTRRSQKRPHSPHDDSVSTTDTSAQESKSILGSNAKQDKLLRLLGGKKRKNEAAASKWLERVRSRDEENKLSTDLESQFNESLSNKISGNAYRRVGMGYQESVPSISDNKDTSIVNMGETKPTESPKSSDSSAKAGDLPPVPHTAPNPSLNPPRNPDVYPRYENPQYGYYQNYRPPPPTQYRPPGMQNYYPPPPNSYMRPQQYLRTPHNQNYEAPPRNHSPHPAPQVNQTVQITEKVEKTENRNLPKTKKDFYAQFKKSS